MKVYIGTKHVKASPMDEAIAVEKGYARQNEDNHEWRQGYHVQYANPDGSTYDSWCPKPVFEQAYRLADTFIDRLQIEHDELKTRLSSLDKFLSQGYENNAKKIGGKQSAMLISQRYAMKTYLDILESRIDNLTTDDNE